MAEVIELHQGAAALGGAAAVHHLPCKIKHDGPAKVATYFVPQRRGADERGNATLQATFRGRLLDGTTLALPPGVVGLVLTEAHHIAPLGGGGGGDEAAAAAAAAAAGRGAAASHASAPAPTVVSAARRRLLEKSKAKRQAPAAVASRGDDDDDDFGVTFDSDDGDDDDGGGGGGGGDDDNDDEAAAGHGDAGASGGQRRGASSDLAGDGHGGGGGGGDDAADADCVHRRVWRVDGAFTAATAWLHDRPHAEADTLRAAVDWFDVARALHAPLEDAAITAQ